MKFLSKKQVREVVVYSSSHIDRMEKAGKFPKRVRLGQNRVAWVEQEVYAWATEMALSVLAYNLTRVLNIVGIKPLMAAIRA